MVPGHDAVVPDEVHEQRVPLIPAQPHLFHVVVEHLHWLAAEDAKRGNVATDQPGQLHRSRELHIIRDQARTITNA
jgi:hypothetical protein